MRPFIGLFEQPVSTEHKIQKPLTFRLSLPYGFRTSWLKRSGLQTVTGQIAAPAAVAEPALITGSITGDFVAYQTGNRVQIFSRSQSPEVVLGVSVEPPNQEDITVLLGTLPDKFRYAPGVLSLAEEVFHNASESLHLQLTASLTALASDRDAELPLLDVMVESHELEAVLAGDLTGITMGALTEDSLLKDFCTIRTAIEVHLPYFDRIHWRKAADSLDCAQVACNPAGQLLVRTPTSLADAPDLCIAALGLAIQAETYRTPRSGSFYLTFSDRRFRSSAQLSALASEYKVDLSGWLPDQDEMVDGTVTLRIHSDLLSIWLDAPRERSANYFPVYPEMSRSIQRALRLWVPYAYFDTVVKYKDTFMAQAMLMYKASDPYAGKLRTQLSYDLLSDLSMDLFFRSASHGLAGVLETAETELLRAGEHHTAGLYIRRGMKLIVQHIRKWHKKVDKLLVGDCRIVDAFVQLGLLGSLIRQQLQKDYTITTQDLCEIGFDWYRQTASSLKRLYTVDEFQTFGALLLIEATTSLHASLHGKCEIEAKVQVRKASGEERTFVNTAWQPR